MSLHWGYIPYLLTLPVETKAQLQRRSRIQKEAVRRGWTAPELYAEIKRHFPTHRRQSSGSLGGRKRKPKSTEVIVRTVVPLLRELRDALAQRWTREDHVDWPELERELKDTQRVVRQRR